MSLPSLLFLSFGAALAASAQVPPPSPAHTATTSPAAVSASKKVRPTIKVVPNLAACPEVIQKAVLSAGFAAKISEISLIEVAGVKTYAFETGDEDDGRDQEVNYHFSDKGLLLKTETDLPFAKAPEVVKAALLKLAGTKYVVDDVEEVLEGKVISYKAELESNGGTDQKVRLSANGDILEQAPEDDD